MAGQKVIKLATLRSPFFPVILIRRFSPEAETEAAAEGTGEEPDSSADAADEEAPEAAGLHDERPVVSYTLNVNGIEVIYNHVILVLKGVSLQLPEKGIVALLGGLSIQKTDEARKRRHPERKKKISAGAIRHRRWDGLPPSAAGWHHPGPGSRICSSRIP